jgi:PHD/YefM family antitoxin component YafN of YafNO toxin-antitoxin module
MRNIVPITEVRRNFGIFHDIALDAPVPISKHGHESVYIVSAKLFREMIDRLGEAGISADFLKPAEALSPSTRAMQAAER